MNGRVISSNMGIDGTKLIVPGDPDRSMLYLRMKRRQDAFNMPPLATHLVDATAVGTVAAWIQSLAVESPVQKPGDATAVVPGRFDKLTNLLQRQVDHHQIAGAVALVLHRGKPV